MDDDQFKEMELEQHQDMMKQFQNVFQNYFVEKESEAGVYYPGTFLMEQLIKYEAQVTDLY